jgi:hypothetical protein
MNIKITLVVVLLFLFSFNSVKAGYEQQIGAPIWSVAINERLTFYNENLIEFIDCTHHWKAVGVTNEDIHYFQWCDAYWGDDYTQIIIDVSGWDTGQSYDLYDMDFSDPPISSPTPTPSPDPTSSPTQTPTPTLSSDIQSGAVDVFTLAWFFMGIISMSIGVFLGISLFKR